MKTHGPDPDTLLGACGWLSERDAVLARAFAAYGVPDWRTGAPDYAVIARMIAFQQITTKAARSIWTRVEAHLGRVGTRPRPAAEARRLGLVHEVVPAAGLDAAVAAELELVLACAPGAVSTTKRLVHYVLRHDEADNLIYTVDRLADFWETEEAREGMQSFFEKRKPAWHRKPAQGGGEP